MTTQIHSRRTIHNGRVFEITVENVTLPTGYRMDMEIIRHPGAAAIVPLLEDNQVVMLKQYRHAVGDFLWEIPAGTFDGSEDPMECARRELAEETGYTAGKWDHLGLIVPVPGYSDERIHLYLARNLTLAAQHLEQDEILEVHILPLQQVAEMIADGQIQDAKTIAAIFQVLIKHTPLLNTTSDS